MIILKICINIQTIYMTINIPVTCIAVCPTTSLDSTHVSIVKQ